MENNLRQTPENRTEPSQHQVTRIDVLPDDVLLEIFDFYTDVDLSVDVKRRLETWQLLVHVCRRWRSIVFGSPRRLDLRLVCTAETPVRDTLDVWPALPLLIRNITILPRSLDEIIVALGQSNRVCQVDLSNLDDRDLKEVVAAMQVPFPELTVLRLALYPYGRTTPVDPDPFLGDSFLGGSAPRLQVFQSDGRLLPGLPKLLFSATHLYYLYLCKIPHSRYFSPEAMAALLSVLSSLKTLDLEFQLTDSPPDWESRRPPTSTRSVVPALVHFRFEGTMEYFEDLVTFIDVPHISNLKITFFGHIDSDGPQLAQFISRTPILEGRDAHVVFEFNTATIQFLSPLKDFVINIFLHRGLGWQHSSVTQVCNTCLPPLSMIEDLYIEHKYGRLIRKESVIENDEWLDLLFPFSVVKNLYLSKDFAPGIAAALQETVGMEALPSLQNIFVERLKPSGPFQENIGPFVTARQTSGHPIAISVWERDLGLFGDVDSDVDL